MISDKDLNEIVETLYQYFEKKIQKEGLLKNYVRSKNASVTSVNTDEKGSTINQTVSVKFPYDTATFNVLNKTGEELKSGDTVCLFYWVDLKNAVAMFKTN